MGTVMGAEAGEKSRFQLQRWMRRMPGQSIRQRCLRADASRVPQNSLSGKKQ